MDALRRIIAVIMFLISFVMISAMGFFPKAISFNLPPSLQSYSSMLPITGFNINDRRNNEPDSKTFKAGTFDGLRLFDNVNIRYNGYYQFSSKNFYWSINGNLYKAKEKENSISEKSTRIIEKSITEAYPVVHLGSYYFFFYDNRVIVHCGKKQKYTITAGCNDTETLISLLEKQTSNRITLKELCDLMIETSKGHLLRFNPNTHTAIVCESDEKGLKQVLNWNTESKEYFKMLEKGSYTDVCACSDTELAYYDVKERKMFYFDYSANIYRWLRKDIDRPSAVNFMWRDKDNLIIAFTTGTIVRESDIKGHITNGWNCGKEVYPRLICGSNGILASNDEYMRYLDYEVF